MNAYRQGATIALTAALLALSVSCSRKEEAVDLESGELVFEETFAQALDDKRWSTARSTAWQVIDGELHAEGARNAPLWLQQPLPDDVRIQFDVRALSNEGDLKFEVFGDGREHQSGYVGIFGGWDNRLNVIARLDEHGEDRLVGAEGRRVEPERTYRFDIVRTESALSWFVDGEHFMTYADEEPLVGQGHEHFAFGNWSAPARFDNLRIYDLSP